MLEFPHTSTFHLIGAVLRANRLQKAAITMASKAFLVVKNSNNFLVSKLKIA
jgi:hypothetical protein